METTTTSEKTEQTITNTLYMYAYNVGSYFCMNEWLDPEEDACYDIRQWRYSFEETVGEQKATAVIRRMFASHMYVEALKCGKNCANCQRRAYSGFVHENRIETLEYVLDQLIGNVEAKHFPKENMHTFIDDNIAENWKQAILLAFKKHGNIRIIDMHTKICIAHSFHINVVAKCYKIWKETA